MTPLDQLRVFVVDDEEPARQRITDLVERHSGLRLAGSFTDAAAALDALRLEPPDVLFLDIRMPHLDGLGLARLLRGDVAPVVVFVTAFEDHALDAFDVEAVDYVLKPFDDARFEAAVQRAREKLRLRAMDSLGHDLLALARARPAGEQRREPEYLQRLSAKKANRTLVIPVDRIDFITADGAYAEIHVDGRSYLIRERMKNLERRLDPGVFCRIHRSTIVRLDRIAELEPHWRGDYVAKLSDGTRLKVTRSRRDALRDRLGIEF